MKLPPLALIVPFIIVELSALYNITLEYSIGALVFESITLPLIFPKEEILFADTAGVFVLLSETWALTEFNDRRRAIARE